MYLNAWKWHIGCIAPGPLESEEARARGLEDSVAPIIESVIGNTLYWLVLSTSVSDLDTCQIASRSDMVA